MCFKCLCLGQQQLLDTWNQKVFNFIANQADTGLTLIIQGAPSVFDADEFNIYKVCHQNLVIFVIKRPIAAMKADPKLLDV